MGYAIVATARNEGPFLVEWIAHHLAIGFDRIFIATNHCDDGSDRLIDLISAKWPVFRIENSEPLERHTFQGSAIKRCLSHPEIAGMTWALNIDLDEFLNLEAPGASVDDLLAPRAGLDALVVYWRLFGDDGRGRWDGGSVLDGYLSCKEAPAGSSYKLFFKPGSFAFATPHCPKAPRRPLDTIRIETTAGAPIDPTRCGQVRGTTLPGASEHATWRGASVNHYVHKSRDLCDLVRVARGDANGRKADERRRPFSPQYEAYNFNEVVDYSIHRHRRARLSLQDDILSSDEILEAHYDAQKWFKAKLLEIMRLRQV